MIMQDILGNEYSTQMRRSGIRKVIVCLWDVFGGLLRLVRLVRNQPCRAPVVESGSVDWVLIRRMDWPF